MIEKAGFIIISFFLSLVVTLFLMPQVIKLLKKVNANQIASEYSMAEYKSKKNIPTMGGMVFVVVPVVISILLKPQGLENPMFSILLAYVGFGFIGFLDDITIVLNKNNKGLSAKLKMLCQLLMACVFIWMYKENINTTITIPLFHLSIPLNSLYFALVLFMFTGTSNAVNLTDGMDGLAAGTVLISLVPFLLLALLQKESTIAVFIASIIGSLLGYLRFNKHPASVFMGDTGSLALGGVLAALAIVLKQEIGLIVIGGVFVWETMSSMIQIASVIIRKKRVFASSPIHYHFQVKGISEPSIVTSFYIIGIVCAVIGFIICVV